MGVYSAVRGVGQQRRQRTDGRGGRWSEARRILNGVLWIPRTGAPWQDLHGRIKANAAITAAGTNGGVSVFATDTTQLILDINGYFEPGGMSSSGLEFFPLTPCRVADTRSAAGPLGRWGGLR